MDDEKPWYMKHTSVGAAYQHFSMTVKQRSVLDDKTKELLRLALASAFRCRHCTQDHIKKAIAAGATKQEISEALLITALQAAGTQLNWDLEDFENYLGTE
jgi:AhpD family alkylhydroperoxidase